MIAQGAESCGLTRLTSNEVMRVGSDNQIDLQLLD